MLAGKSIQYLQGVLFFLGFRLYGRDRDRGHEYGRRGSWQCVYPFYIPPLKISQICLVYNFLFKCSNPSICISFSFKYILVQPKEHTARHTGPVVFLRSSEDLENSTPVSRAMDSLNRGARVTDGAQAAWDCHRGRGVTWDWRTVYPSPPRLCDCPPSVYLYAYMYVLAQLDVRLPIVGRGLRCGCGCRCQCR